MTGYPRACECQNEAAKEFYVTVYLKRFCSNSWQTREGHAIRKKMANFWRRVSKLMITVLHTSVFVMLLIAIINKNWLEKETSLGTYHQGLWHTCVGDVCLSLDSSGTPIKYGNF